MGVSLKWRYINAGVPGTAHLALGLPCQDSCFVDVLKSQNGEEFLVAIASDGAGTATNAEDGSDRACTALLKAVETWTIFKNNVNEINKAQVEAWLLEAREALVLEAKVQQKELREFACTLILAVIGEPGAIYAQIGDGGIVVSDGEGYRPVFWPEAGTYANMTYFLTDDNFQDHIQYQYDVHSPFEVALFTDGLQRLALQYDSRTAYAPFFRPMFYQLRGQPPGVSEILTVGLAEFLKSEAVNARTDDDKTLILATRQKP